MRNAIFGSVAAMLAVFAVWYFASDRASSTPADAARLDEHAAVSGAGPEHIGGLRSTNTPAPSTPSLQQEQRVQFAPLDRREGEQDESLRTRTLLHDQFERFRTKANLTEEQSQQVLRILFDAQLNALQADADSSNARIKGDRAGTASFIQASVDIRDEIRRQVAEILSPEQVKVFRNEMTPDFLFLLTKPFEAQP
jgi:hypothetical protein